MFSTRMQVVEARLPAADRQQLVPPKRISLANVARAGAAKPSLPAAPPLVPPPSRGAVVPRSKGATAEPCKRPQKPPLAPPPPVREQTRSLQPLTPPVKPARAAAAAQQLPKGAASAKPPAGYSRTRSASEHAQQLAVHGRRDPLRAATGAGPRPAVAAGEGASHAEQSLARGEQPSRLPDSPEPAKQTDDRRTADKQAADSANCALRQPATPPSPRSWWLLGLSKSAVAPT